MLKSIVPSLFRSARRIGSRPNSLGSLETPPRREEIGSRADKSILRHAHCWLCGGELKYYWSLAEEGRDYNTTYLRCRQCGLLMVSPYLSDPGLGISPEQHDNYVNDVDKYTSSICVEGFLYLLDKAEYYWFKAGRTGRGRLLEVGSAAGYFLSGARARTWQVDGIEPAAPVAMWSRRYLQLPIHHGFYESTELPDASYDMVVAIEVLEHLLDPVNFTRWIHRKLKPGGMVFLTTPNSYSKAYYPPKRDTAILCPMDHLNLFSCQTLPCLLLHTGFQSDILETDGPDGLQLQIFAFKPTMS